MRVAVIAAAIAIVAGVAFYIGQQQADGPGEELGQAIDEAVGKAKQELENLENR